MTPEEQLRRAAESLRQTRIDSPPFHVVRRRHRVRVASTAATVVAVLVLAGGVGVAMTNGHSRVIVTEPPTTLTPDTTATTEPPTTTTTVPTTTTTVTPTTTTTTVPFVKGGSGIVDADGHVGALTFGVSTQADVEAFAGKADVTTPDTHVPTTDIFAPYDGLGYDCTPNQTDPLDSCATRYYVNARTHTLVAFVTTSPRFMTPKGTHIGMSLGEALRRGETAVPFGCLPYHLALGSYYSSGSASYVVLFVAAYDGAAPPPSTQITSIANESNTNPVGVLFC